MIVKQVSVFLENRPGRLTEMFQILADSNIDIRALSMADTTDFGIVRMVLSDTDKALAAFAKCDFTAGTTDVLSVCVPDEPGGLLRTVAIPLAEREINVEYVYAFVERPQEAAKVVLKVSDLNKAMEVLKS